MSDTKTEVRERCLQIQRILRDKWIGAHRAHMCSINDFKHWQPSEVEAPFALLPDLKERKLSPHGPESRPPPADPGHWKHFAMKVAMLGAVDTMAVAISPLALVSKTLRKELWSSISKLNYELIGSSFFVKCPLDLLRQAAAGGIAVCVNGYGQFSVRDSGYAAISHVWAEMMGLEFNNEKIEQDGKGLDYAHFSHLSHSPSAGYSRVLDISASHMKTIKMQVSHAISAMRAAVGDNRLMPEPEVECLLINADSGYARTNHSWIRSRMMRDFEYWRDPVCDQKKAEKLKLLRDENERKRQALEAERLNVGSDTEKELLDKTLRKLPQTNLMRIGLRITVWECVDVCAQGSGDWIYWIGILVSVVQLGISAVPWGLYGEWYTFLVTAAGTSLAYLSAVLPQWVEEKTGIRTLTKRQKDLAD